MGVIVSTFDWKTELRRRIASIRERKSEERDSRQRATIQNIPRATASSVALPVEEPTEDTLSDADPGDARESAEEEPTPAESEYSGIEVAEEEKARSIDEGAFESPIKPDAVSTESSQPVPTAAELPAPEPATKEKEPTLFPLHSTIEDEGIAAAAGEGRKQEETDTAAPAASDLDAALDHYTPLEQLPDAQDAELDKPPGEREDSQDSTHYMRNLRRLTAAAIDGVLLAGVVAILLIVAGILLEASPFNMIAQSLLPLGIMFLSLQFLYYVLFTSLTGQTLGKLILGLKVVRSSGERIGLAHAFARWTALILSLIPLGLGYFWMYSQNGGRSWHDILLGMSVEDSK